MKAPRANRRRRLAALVAIVLLMGWILTAPFAADSLIADRPQANADAIVILSGAADYTQRAEGGARAFREGAAVRILLTDDDQRGGWDDTEKGNPYFVERTSRELTRLGVPGDAIEILPGKVGGTGDEAELVVRTAVERGYRGIIIVTSDYHSRRALWAFDRAAENHGSQLSVGLARSPSGVGYPGRWTWWLTPRGWRSVGAEYLKFGYYWLFY